MKNTVHASLHFLFNPLKPVKQDSNSKSNKSFQTPYLRSVLSGRSSATPVYSIRSLRDILSGKFRPIPNKNKVEIDGEKDWYNNYE
jgi:hypothetical protein